MSNNVCCFAIDAVCSNLHKMMESRNQNRRFTLGLNLNHLIFSAPLGMWRCDERGVYGGEVRKEDRVVGPSLSNMVEITTPPGHVHFKRMQDMSKDGLIHTFDMDTEKCKTCMLTKITKKPFQNVKCETEVLELIHSDLCDLHATPSLGNKKYFVTFIDDLSVTKSKDSGLIREGEYMDTLYFVSVEIIHENDCSSITPQQKRTEVKGFGFMSLEPNVSVSINSIIESKDAIFSDENIFSLVPRLSLSIPYGIEDIGCSIVPEEVTEEVVQQPEPELRKSKRNRTSKDFGPDFQLYLIEGTRDEDVAFLKEAINDEMDSIMGNNTWVLADLPLGCKPIGCKWIFKRKLKLDGTIEKFKARLVIQGFKQKSGINYFDTYALVARISTIRLLIVMTSINNLIIHQMDVKTAFLNGDLDEEVYMNQPQGFIMHGNENKVCKLVKSLYGLKQEPKQWHQKFDEVVLSNGYLLNQADKYVDNKFDEIGKGVIICLYVNDMLIFGTDQVQVDLTKEFLSSRFSMKDMGEADVILGIRIKHESNGISISQSHYIKKYSSVIGCLMYAMSGTRHDIAFAVGKLSRYTSNPGTQYWQAIQRINSTKDNSSTSSWVFLLGGGAISWASKKQTCITGSAMEYEFVALAAAGNEAEWLKNLLLEISLWSKPITPISIRCDGAATLAKAYGQKYNEKSRHLGVRHSMIHELIMNGVISIEFVRSQQNLADHLTNGLARDLVIKSAEGMRLKSN
ncbi:zinc finger, CCHC-type containing protein [Tanacetum coccineum]